jgi:hypothetical protein
MEDGNGKYESWVTCCVLVEMGRRGQAIFGARERWRWKGLAWLYVDFYFCVTWLMEAGFGECERGRGGQGGRTGKGFAVAVAEGCVGVECASGEEYGRKEMLCGVRKG